MHVHTTFTHDSFFNRILWWCYFGRRCLFNVIAIHGPWVKLSWSPLRLGSSTGVHRSRSRRLLCCWSIRVNLLVSTLGLLIVSLWVQRHNPSRVLSRLHGSLVGYGTRGGNLLGFFEIATSRLLSFHSDFLIGGLHVWQCCRLVHRGWVLLVPWVVR